MSRVAQEATVSLDGYSALVAAVLRQALSDTRKGSGPDWHEACVFLQSPDVGLWAALVDLDADDLQAQLLRTAGLTTAHAPGTAPKACPARRRG